MALSDLFRPIAGALPWLVDAFKAPGRIKTLAEGLQSDRDPRPYCRSCGTGRVGALEILAQSTTGASRGVCDNCNTNFLVTADGRLGRVLLAISEHGAPGQR